MGRRVRPRLCCLMSAAAVVTALAGTAGAASTSAASSASATHSAYLGVVVQASPGHVHDAGLAVRQAGGRVGRQLPIVDGFAARLPASALRRLAGDATIRQITPDSAVHFSNFSFASGTVASNYPKSTGATSAWKSDNLGAGVTVALIDTGVARVDDLEGRIIAGPDFSGEKDSTADSYGHGTVMAGIIAGDGTDSASQTDGGYVGMAPRANVLSVKVAGRNGATDVSTVLAALQWVGSHQSKYHIRAVNIAWGTTSHQSPSVDPLNYAVERLWHSGVVVVAAAGNDGPSGGTITKPGDDPLVLTAGAYKDRLNTLLSDDSMAGWSSRGPTAAGYAKPDLVAPGRTLIATRSPGSTVDIDNPAARVGSAYIRGSGTSQATAVVSGSVALLLGDRADLGPDQVKYAVTSAAMPMPAVSRTAQGHGRVWVPGALTSLADLAPTQGFTGSGLGSLEDSRGGRHIDTVCPGDTTVTTIAGEQDALCQPWQADQWTADSWSADSWSADSWSSDSWSADSWSADSWSADSWSNAEFLTAFWGERTPWWRPLPGEVAAARPVATPTRSVALSKALASIVRAHGLLK